MFLTIFAFAISLIALIVATILVGRHWKEIQLLDPLSIKEEQQRQKREAVIRRRFDTSYASHIESAKRMSLHLADATRKIYRELYQRLQAFEALYKNVKSPFATLAPTSRERIKTLQEEARSLSRDLKWADAERRLLEMLSIDPKNADAYKGLGQIYLKQKMYPQAKETFEFVVKLKQEDDAVYAGLAELAETEGNVPRAEAMRLKAVEKNPRHAYRHADLASFYLAHGEAIKAWPSAKRASDLDPKSAKYLELSLETAILLGNRLEAQKRYDRLRLLSDDPARYNAWKEKIENIKTVTKN